MAYFFSLAFFNSKARKRGNPSSDFCPLFSVFFSFYISQILSHVRDVPLVLLLLPPVERAAEIQQHVVRCILLRHFKAIYLHGVNEPHDSSTNSQDYITRTASNLSRLIFRSVFFFLQ